MSLGARGAGVHRLTLDARELVCSSTLTKQI